MKIFMKKSLSLLLALLLVISLSSVAFAADGEGAVMQTYTTVSTEDFHAEKYEGRIGRIIFLDLAEAAFPENVTYDAEFDLSGDPLNGVVTAKIAMGVNADGVNSFDMYIGARNGVIAPSDCSYLFADTGVEELVGLQNFDTSNVTSAKAMFRGCGFKQFDFDTFNIPRTADMSYMFKDCYVLESVKAEKTLTSHVTDFSHMFDGCVALTDFAVKNFDLSSAKNIDYMFYGCTALEEIDLSSWVGTSGITSINAFRNCPALTSVNFSGWDFSSVATLDGVFAYCDSLRDIYFYDIKDASSCTSSWENPVKGATGLTVHTDNIDFTDTKLWSNCFGKSADVKVAYNVAGGAEVAAVTFEKHDAVEYYVVKVNGDERNIYGGSTMNLAKGTAITINIKLAEDAVAKNLNVNGEAVAIGSTITLSSDTNVTIQTYHDNTAMEPDENVENLSKFLFAIKDLIQRITDVLQGFFGRFMPWID